ncbi:MAG: hypothetical protein Satyrvirus1_27 [Satyrvirus sp.]|uniref:Uncharacterized protein n=1 Tax=Satyrvirus sp. TaxID=2487771 RepID=A0A3G5AF86_9VIRU|nr:MAG: hypothetical protein Satyrvirus1_27 [Satyrvirus sp.]
MNTQIINRVIKCPKLLELNYHQLKKNKIVIETNCNFPYCIYSNRKFCPPHTWSPFYCPECPLINVTIFNKK